MIAYIFLALFTIAAVIFIVNSHYRWTYFFAITLFTFLFGGVEQEANHGHGAFRLSL